MPTSRAEPRAPLGAATALDRALDSPPAAPPSARLQRALDDETQRSPVARKRLVGPDVNYGRELLTALALRGGGWVGWEATNLRGIAEELAFVPLARAGRRAGNDIEIGALVGRALDGAIAGGRVDERFAALERSLGFRRALRDSLLELRIAGVSAARVRTGADAGSPAAGLAEVLDEYERLLDAGDLVDPAGVFRAALDAFDDEAPYVLDGEVLLAPALPARGLPADLVARLLARGARVLPGDPAHGVADPAGLTLPDPDGEGSHSLLAWAGGAAPATDPGSHARLDPGAVAVDLYAAATPSEELREVFRRAAAEGVRWDEVEIFATDADTYGVALDALCQRLGVGATMLHGVPLPRTRLGRALDRWLAWLEDGLPADTLRQALEAGELAAPDADVAPTALARELRALRVGWGRARYAAALAALEGGAREARLAQREDEPDGDFAERVASRRRSGRGLAALLRALLDTTPPVPERGSDRPVRASAAALARSTLGWLALVPVHGPAERQTAERLQHRLAELAEVAGGETSFSGALAMLRDALSDMRAWPLVTSERKPWSASGGMVHLTDVVHAGTTGRRRVFVVGLDANRTAGPVRQDPLLTDRVRRAVAPGALPTSVDRRDECAYQLAAALASLRGRVTLSYATSGALDGREAGPSPVLLQAWRLLRGDFTLSYERLREHLRPPASAVPVRGPDVALLDARDVWLDAIADGALLLDGGLLVRASFPMLDAGLRAAELARAASPSAYHGVIPQAAGLFDPAARPGREISPSALETLAKCPLAWFYRHGLSLYPPNDPAYDAEFWLSDLDRGSLLHEVYEAFTLRYQGRQHEIAADAARADILAITDEAIARWRELVPPPGETVFDAECAELRRASLAFLEMERGLAAGGDAGTWTHLEYAFGGGAPAGRYALDGGAVLAIKGRADRLDTLPDGTLRVIDYKTGGTYAYMRNRKAAPFNGGRQLQAALYAAVVESLTGTTVSRFEYRFPTERGRNEVVGYDAAELAPARPLVSRLLGHVRDGTFLPTNEGADCKFCDYQSVCRSRTDGYGAVHSPRAAWAAEHAPGLPIFQGMLERRAAEADA